MREISANSWATKIDYLPTRINEITYSPVREWHRTRPRAKTSHSIQRPSHGAQNLSPNVVLRGTGINGTGKHYQTEPTCGTFLSADDKHGDISKRQINTNSKVRPKLDSRPKTSLGFCPRQSSDVDSGFKDLVEVYSFKADGKQLKITKIEQDISHEKKALDAQTNATDAISFKSEPSQEKRSKPLSLKFHSQPRESCGDINERQISLTPSLRRNPDYNPNRSDSRLSTCRRTNARTDRSVHRKPSLRPLLNDHRSGQHSKECPYKCRNCFRACLVSDSYIRSVSRSDLNSSDE